MLSCRRKFFEGLGSVALATAGGLTILGILVFFVFSNFDSGFWQKEISLKDLKTSEPNLSSPLATGSPPLLAKILPEAPKNKKPEVIFNIQKPEASSSTSLVLPSVSDNFFEVQNQPTKTEEPVIKPFVKILISELMFESQKSTKDEFVELYNPNDFAVNLSQWQLRKQTRSGEDSVLLSAKKFSGVIQSKSFFVVSHNEAFLSINPNQIWSSSGYSLSAHNSVYLLDEEDRQVDLVGCGQAMLFEKVSCSAPESGQSVSRLNLSDTDNNFYDFAVSEPTPGKVNLKTEVVSGINQSATAALASPLISLAPTLLSSVFPSPVNSPVDISPSPEFSLVPSLSPIPSIVPLKLLINKVQVTGGTGLTDNDLIEIYNPNSETVNLKGYRLVKRTKTGATDYSIKSFTEDFSLAPSSKVVWANSNFSVAADFKTTTTLASDNAVAIRFGKLDEGELIDSVGWGSYSGSFCETSCFSENPGADQVLQRKDFVDTGNNASDFEIFAP